MIPQNGLPFPNREFCYCKSHFTHSSSWTIRYLKLIDCCHLPIYNRINTVTGLLSSGREERTIFIAAFRIPCICKMEQFFTSGTLGTLICMPSQNLALYQEDFFFFLYDLRWNFLDFSSIMRSGGLLCCNGYRQQKEIKKRIRKFNGYTWKERVDETEK